MFLSMYVYATTIVERVVGTGNWAYLLQAYMDTRKTQRTHGNIHKIVAVNETLVF